MSTEWNAGRPLTAALIEQGLLRLTGVYQPLIDASGVATLQQTWEEVLFAHPWLTADVFGKAVSWTLAHVDGQRVPTPAAFLETCRAIKGQLDRQADWAQADLHRAALPLHDTPPEADAASASGAPRFASLPREERRAFWDYNVAIGKARIRKRFALIDAWRTERHLGVTHGVPEEVWRGLDEPTDEEVKAVLLEMRVEQISVTIGGVLIPVGGWLLDD